jgi:hypothetical protein
MPWGKRFNTKNPENNKETKAKVKSSKEKGVSDFLYDLDKDKEGGKHGHVWGLDKDDENEIDGRDSEDNN